MTDPDLAGAIGDDLAAARPLTAGALNAFALERLTDPQLPDTAAGLATLLVAIDALRALLAAVKAYAEAAMHDAMGEELTLVLDGFGAFTRTRQKDRTQWDKDDLLRRVLDSHRLVTVTPTGPDGEKGESVTIPDPERMDETDLDRVLDVWNLGAPRTTALRARGIDPDEFCHVERGRPIIRITPAQTRPIQ